MRTASAALTAHLDSLRAGDGTAIIADLYTFTLRNGRVLAYTNADVSVDWNGVTFLANSVLVDGLRYRCSVGLDVDQQQITIAAHESDTVGGVPFLQALRNGIFDGCRVARERAFLAGWGMPPIGTILLFKGRIGTIDRIGRTKAELTVNSDLVLLDVEIPRNIYTPSCTHVLYDSGCGLTKEAYGQPGTAEEGSTTTVIVWSGAAGTYKQGTLSFTSGVNSGLTTTIKDASGSALMLAYPLLVAPSVGDTFTVYQGCDHTQVTCAGKFDNLVNFRGFPYIPPPTHAI